MEIVTASLRDFNALSKLEHVCFEKDAWPFIDLLAALTFTNVVRLKAVEDDQMVAFVVGAPHPSEGFSWIATIAVLPEYRRRGIGRSLLLACEGKLKTPRIRLSVRASNEGAIRLYDQEGYQRTEVWQSYYNDGEAAIVMEKARAI